MKKLALILVTLALVIVLNGFAQNQGSTSQQTSTMGKASTQAVSLTGKVSDDGKTFVSDKDNKSWTVSNPEALKGHEGHEVKIKAHEDAAKSEIHVVSVKMKSEKTETMQK
jgi:membrane protein implicated in regulation of membrane protease activity